MDAGYILALRFCDAMRENKEMFSCRLLPLAKQLIKAEAEHHECSEAEIVERWAFTQARSPDARRLLIAHAAGDVLAGAIADVMRDDQTEYKARPPKTHDPPGKRKAS